jgi:hypothetical protein
MNITKSAIRKSRGSFIAELPLALWLLFLVFMVPFLDMATVLLRYTFIVSATRDGVHAAAKSKTYLTNASASDTSAVNSAPAAVALTASCFSEIQINNVQAVAATSRHEQQLI